MGFWQSLAGCPVSSAVRNGNSRAALQGRWKFSREVAVVSQERTRGKNKKFSKCIIQTGAGGEVFPQIKAAAQEGSEGHDTFSNTSSQHSLFNLVG